MEHIIEVADIINGGVEDAIVSVRIASSFGKSEYKYMEVQTNVLTKEINFAVTLKRSEDPIMTDTLEEAVEVYNGKKRSDEGKLSALAS